MRTTNSPAIAVSGLVVSPAFFLTSSRTAPGAQTIIERSAAANQKDWDAAPDYSCFERDQIAGIGTKTYLVTMILGPPYEGLVAANGKPLSPGNQAAEQDKLERVLRHRREEAPETRAG